MSHAHTHASSHDPLLHLPQSGRQAIKNPILREDVLMARMAGRQRKAKPAAAEGGELDPFAPEYGKETWHAAGGGRAGGRVSAAGAGDGLLGAPRCR